MTKTNSNVLNSPVATHYGLLPNDVLKEIAIYLTNDFRSLQNMQLTCKQFHEIFISNAVWKIIFDRLFPNPITPIKNYYQVYRELFRHLKKQYNKKNIVVTLAGNLYIGKESLVLRHTHNFFNENTEISGEYNFSTRCTLFDETTVRVEFCCADSNSDYSSLRDTLYRNGQSFLFCFAVDDRTSFEDLEEIAQNVKRTKDGETYGALLVALRSDLQHVVKEEEMKSFVEKHGFGGYVITSSKTNTNVAEAFNRSIELAIKTTVPVEIVELVAQGKSITNTKHKKCVLC